MSARNGISMKARPFRSAAIHHAELYAPTATDWAAMDAKTRPNTVRTFWPSRAHMEALITGDAVNGYKKYISEEHQKED